MDLLDELLDQRNKNLWEKLYTGFNITVALSDQYKLDFSPPNATILIDNRKNVSLFTHELLHLELRYLGLDAIKYFSLESYTFEEVRIVYNLCNNLEHILMFDEFIYLGFEKTAFVEGLSGKKQLEQQIEIYHDLVTKPDFCNPTLYFVSLYVTIKSEQYCGQKREYFLEKLRRKNPGLHKKCENLYNDILNMDFDSDLQTQYVNVTGRICDKNSYTL